MRFTVDVEDDDECESGVVLMAACFGQLKLFGGQVYHARSKIRPRFKAVISSARGALPTSTVVGSSVSARLRNLGRTLRNGVGQPMN